MAAARIHLPTDRMGGMNNRVDPELLRVGQFVELRNFTRRFRRVGRRDGWAKYNAARMPWGRAIGSYAYRNTAGTLHWIVLGDDGKIYRIDGGAWSEITLHDNIVWDETNKAAFAAWRDYLFIAVGSTTGNAPVGNIRYDSIKQEAFKVSLDAPGAPGSTQPAVTAGAHGSGILAAGTYSYCYTYVDVDTGWESDRSGTADVEVKPGPGVSEVQTITPTGGLPTGGTYRIGYTDATGLIQWTESIEYDASASQIQEFLEALPNVEAGDVTVSGGPLDTGALTFTFRSANTVDANGNVTEEGLGDVPLLQIATNNLADGGGVTYPVVETVEGKTETDAEATVLISGILPYPGSGRTIQIWLYRSVNGEGYLLHDADIGTTYTDNTETSPGPAYVRYERIPPCTGVAVQRNGLVAWTNDVENEEAATIYLSYDVNTPEAIGTTVHAGEDSDPITGPYAVRDGIAVFKRRSIYWYPRQCDEICESYLEGVGCVAWATIQNIGREICFLSAEGPRVIDDTFSTIARFVGPDPLRFALAETWANVIKTRLPYASSVHWPERGIVAWFVQMCNWGGEIGQHNDTAIIWDYGSRSAANPGGEVYIHDIICDQGVLVPVDGSEEDLPCGAFPMGYVGRLWDGQHGDGIALQVSAPVVAADGQYVWLGETLLDPGYFLGSVFFVYEGTGALVCSPVSPCDRPNALIIDEGTDSAGRWIKLNTPLNIDATSKAWIGGFLCVARFCTDFGDPDTQKNIASADIQFKGESP